MACIKSLRFFKFLSHSLDSWQTRLSFRISHAFYLLVPFFLESNRPLFVFFSAAYKAHGKTHLSLAYVNIFRMREVVKSCECVERVKRFFVVSSSVVVAVGLIARLSFMGGFQWPLVLLTVRRRGRSGN